jgi:PTS system galactitol-specific IIB component
MKKMLVICGTGVATSTVVMHKLNEWLKSKGFTDVQLFQSKIADEIAHLEEYDIVLSTTLVPDHVKDQVIMGVPILTGVGADKVYDLIEEKIKALS